MGGLNCFSSKTNCGRRIKFLDLEVPWDIVSAPTFKFFEFRHLIFSVFRLTFFLCANTPKPPKLETGKLEM